MAAPSTITLASVTATGLPIINSLHLRRRMAAAVQLLIDALDAIDPDPDIEDGDDAEADQADAEPSLGWPARFDQSLTDRSDSSDRELDPTECSMGEAA